MMTPTMKMMNNLKGEPSMENIVDNRIDLIFDKYGRALLPETVPDIPNYRPGRSLCVDCPGRKKCPAQPKERCVSCSSKLYEKYWKPYKKN